MARDYSSFARRFFVFLNVIAAVIFLLATLAPYLNPSTYWILSFAGLGFPIVSVLCVLFLLFWTVVKPKYILISLLPLLVGWKAIAVFFAFGSPGRFNYEKPKTTLRVVSWNVARFIELSRNNNEGSQTRLKMLAQIKAQDADVLCLQEFYHAEDKKLYNNIDTVKALGYPYFYYSWDGDGGNQWFGQAIFSRYPIIDSGIVRYPRPGIPEALISADILFNGDTVRLYTTHLQSVQFKKADYKSLQQIKNREDSLLQNSRNIFSKLKRGFVYRAQQADIVREITANSPHPFIVTGDFNDVPNTYTYFTIRGKLQDAFLKQGFGIGRTYSGISPTLRIDYILATDHFSVLQFNRVPKNYSDHYMLVADLRLEK
jgi:endonuclease/exonuclease/phosphatase family metal-dependent hydrolase